MSSRPTHSRQTSSISRPFSPGPIHAVISPPTSPSQKTKTKSRRPSVTSPMNWLARTSSNASTQSVPYAPSRPVRISEPRFADPVEAYRAPRSGILGTGATVVRTPQEALAGPRASTSTPDLHSRVRSPSPVHSAILEFAEDDDTIERAASPPLPPIPDDVSDAMERVPETETEADEDIDTDDDQLAPLPVSTHPPAPTRAPPSLPSIPDFHSDLEPAPPVRSVSPLRRNKSPLDYFPPVPPLPSSALPTPPQSPFQAILVSPVPNGSLDPSRIIVSLETSTATQRTTMSTLISRPSHLASYLLGLFPSTEEDTRSVYSTASDVDSSFNSIFNHHLASSGILKHASTNLQIFLDRPSAPYAHILAYLRSPVSTHDAPASLPHGARLNGSCSRVEALLELRDEASYLGLDELLQLCMDELRHQHHPQQQASPASLPGLHLRGLSDSSNRSLHTLREERTARTARRKSDDSGFVDAEGVRRSGGSGSSDGASAPWPSPPSSRAHVHLQEGSPRKGQSAMPHVKGRPTGAWI